MASSSASPLPKRFKYDVFLSFRGEDVRKTFIDHLYASLDRQGILTFRDDKRLTKGERIDNELIGSIQDSKFFIIVFSQNYASSSWCLNELVEIMECQRNEEQIAYPVFYDVDPSEVRKQRGSYDEALTKHSNNEEVGKWREALLEAGKLSGFDVKNTAAGHEAEVIKLIVAEISNRLRFTYYLSNDDKLVGMETRIPHLLSRLDINSNDVRMIGIKGMGGAGKTTLARVIFERISFMFEGVSFVDNVRENSKSSPSGLQLLQGKILSDVLKEPHIVSSCVDGERMMRNRLCGIKALVVLDDIDDLSQLEALAGAFEWFKQGSRIIITTRDEQVLEAHGAEIMNVNFLSDGEAICLFNRYACKGDILFERYKELSLRVVHYAAGLPLTIKVLGSLLRGKRESVWIDVLKRLKTIPLKQTLDILELSYISLEDDHKDIFLHIACLLTGCGKKRATRMLESCGFYATYGLTVLEQKSLITFSSARDTSFPYPDDDDDLYLDMHDHIKEMGRNIAHREQPYERLWIDKEIKDVLSNDLGAEATRCIKVITHLSRKILMESLTRMKNLKFLHVDYLIADWECDEGRHYFPNALQYLYWRRYPCCSLPNIFQANNLVALEMPFSNIKQLWEGGEIKVLCNLKFLDLSYSKLTKLDLGLTPNVEVLKLKSCDDLSELHMSVGCPQLRSLDLSCSSLTKLKLGPTQNLEVLKLKFCFDLLELDISTGCPKLRCLDLRYSNLMIFELGPTPNLKTLNLCGCFNLVESDMLVEFAKLKSLELSLSKSKTLDLGLTPNLKVSKLDPCYDLKGVHKSVGYLKELTHSKSFRSLRSKSIVLTKELVFLDIPSLYSNHSIRSLKNILENTDKLPNLRTLIELLKLLLSCTKIRDLPNTSFWLISLQSLKLECCMSFEELPEAIDRLRFLQKLHLTSTRIKRLPNSICLLKRLKSLQLVCCRYLEELPELIDGLRFLEKLHLSSTHIKHLPNKICLLKRLKFLQLVCCQYLEELPDDLDQSECLEDLIVQKCKRLRGIPNSICKMKSLNRFHIPCCAAVEKLPEEIGDLTSLMELNIVGTGIKRLPANISSLTDLRIIRYPWDLGTSGFTFTSVQHISKMPKGGTSRYCNSYHAREGSNQHTS